MALSAMRKRNTHFITTTAGESFKLLQRIQKRRAKIRIKHWVGLTGGRSVMELGNLRVCSKNYLVIWRVFLKLKICS